MPVMVTLYKLLSLGLSYPEEKNRALLDNLLDESGRRISGKPEEHIAALKGYLSGSKPSLRDLQHEYLEIFDTAVKVSPYETEYLTEKISRKPFELADIAGFYRAFGIDVDEDSVNKEPVDHIAVELEFMAILAFKEAYAARNGREEHSAIVLEARTKFLKDHLLRWGFIYCSRVREIECSTFYKILGNILESVLDMECENCGLDAPRFKKDMGRVPYRGAREEDLTCGQLLHDN